ncbi:Protein T2 [Stygiomarasmius scandens]|uniref:Protein T2 n=1 Tax=Marasmiellus scandens TaxID=2682957 RepID=A0ABR1JFL7_9AGAR
MPLSRSNTTRASRSRSRSPAAPILSNASTQSRPFLPPSHYAAAGGFTLPDKGKSSERSASRSSYACQDGYSPSSFLVPDSDTSFEGRSSTDSHSTSSSAKSPCVSALKRRQSQYSNLPLVEAQLLPSLRDTIDRMTRPPSRAAVSPLSPIPTPNTPTLRISHDDHDETPNSYSSPRSRTPLVSESSMNYDRASIVNQPSTPKPAQTPKSALKSALRTPTSSSKSSSSKAEDAHGNASSSQSPGVGSTLRSVRSLLMRKPSFSSATTSSEKEKQSSKENAKPTESFSVLRAPSLSSSTNYTRSRSRTDPGTLPTFRERDSSLGSNQSRFKAPGTPQPTSVYTLKKEKELASSSKSSIPRFSQYQGQRGRSGSCTGSASSGVSGAIPRSFHTHAAQSMSTDTSDMEYRYELSSRDRRKLTVMNAEIVPSSSSSEGEPDGEGSVSEVEGVSRDDGQCRDDEEDSVVFNGVDGLSTSASEDSDDFQSNSSLDQAIGMRLRLGLPLAHGHGLIGLGLRNNQHVRNPGDIDLGGRCRDEDLDEDMHMQDDQLLKMPRVPDARMSVYSMASYQSEGSIYTDGDRSMDEEASRDEQEDEIGGDANGTDEANLDETLVEPERETESESRLRRRTALLGLVNGLQSRFADTTNGSSDDTSSLRQGDAEESDYHGEDGFAVTLSPSNSSETGFVNLKGGAGVENKPSLQATPKVKDTHGLPTTSTSPDIHKPFSSRRMTIASKSTSNSPEEASFPRHRDRNNDRGTEREKNRRATVCYKEAGTSSSSATVVTSRIPPPSSRCGANTGSTSKALYSAASPTSVKNDVDGTSKRKSLMPQTQAHDHHLPSHMQRSPSPNPSRRSLVKPDSVVTVNANANVFEAVRIAKQSREVAARNRQAWGIPPSESDQDRDGSGTLVAAESVASSVDNLKCEVDSPENDAEDSLVMSRGAEKLFRTLSGREGKKRDGGSSKMKRRSRSATPTPSSRSHQVAASDVKEDARGGSREKTQRETSPSTRPLTPCEQIVAKYTQIPESKERRQDIIVELCDMENVFVNRLLSVVDLFILPLRVQDTKVWISGVPLEIAKMLDWFEDIVNLHVELKETLYSIKLKMGNSDVELVADSLKGFVQKLEVYQPYLVKLENVKDMLERLGKDQSSDFGEFVRIQEKNEENGGGAKGWTLVKLLTEPSERLGMYNGMFRKLLDATPKAHQDYLSTFTLVHSAALVIKVLNEVKEREEEYELIKSLTQRIDGLPLSTQLARRERRLLCQGPLLQVNKEKLESHDEEPNKPSRTSVSKTSRMSRLVDAINEWDVGRGRSGSVKSNSSASTGVSFRSVETSSPPPSSSSMPLQVLVFSDLVVFVAARSRRENQEQGTERWALSPDIGICRVLDVAEVEGPDAESLLMLDVVPIGPDLDQGALADNSVIKSLHFRLPDPRTSSSPKIPTKQVWLSSFKRSVQSTLRTLSDPYFSRDCLMGPNKLLEHDRRRILNSILASGLPFPKSPSLQEASIAMRRNELDYDNDSMRLEREERGWWSLRFKQVLQGLLHEDYSRSWDI